MNDPSPTITEREPRLPPRILRQLSFGWLGLALGLVIASAAFMVFAAAQRRGQLAPPVYEGTPMDELAADFHLIDQTGASESLSDLRGQVVILTFFDSQCEETCPLTAMELRTASQRLGDQQGSVAFVAINVNNDANTMADVAATTQQWRLHEIPVWHFLTGSTEELEPIWAAYHVTVMPAEGDEEELLHTPGVYVIDQAGRTRWYISTPLNEAGNAQMTAPLSELLVKHIQALLEES